MRDSIEISAVVAEFSTAQAFVEGQLKRVSVSSQLVSETMVVFEAVFGVMIMQGFDSNTTISISSVNKLGDFCLKVVFEGKRFVPTDDGEDGTSPELRILEGYADKISCSYHSGYNVIRISVRKTHKTFHHVHRHGLHFRERRAGQLDEPRDNRCFGAILITRRAKSAGQYTYWYADHHHVPQLL